MRWVFKITLIFLCFLILGGLFGKFKSSLFKPSLLEAKVFIRDFHQYNFPGGENLILEAFSQKLLPVQKKKILGGIVSHHLPTALPLISRFYQSLQKENPKVIFVLGPDHFHKASFSIVTTDLPFYTPFGYLQPDKEIIDLLEKENLVKIDDKVFKNEHSILSQTFFIKYLFPKAKIAPLILRPEVKIDDARRLAKAIGRFQESALFIASVDFSHYLPLKEALALDQKTKESLEDFHFENLTLKECDSPLAVQILFLLAKEEGYHFEVLEMKNSAEFSQVQDRTTGYITAIFRREE